MNRSLWTLIAVGVIVALAVVFILPKTIEVPGRENMKLGLDLKGGVQLTYTLDLSTVENTTPAQAKQEAINVIEKRINKLGVAEAVIQSTDVDNQPGIMIELPGVSDTATAKDLIGQTAQLVFKKLDEEGNFVATELTGANLKSAKATFNQGSQAGGFSSAEPIVELSFNETGTELFAQLTKENIQKQLAIELDGEIISAPTVQTEITDGQAIITGIGDIEEAKELALLLNAGALPVPIILVAENSIGATLGQESIENSLLAGILGIILVAVFMMIYYRKAGILASIALFVYLVLSMAIFKLIPVTMTLAGIAGFIFSVGAAVDANVLVFERFKEELKKGKEAHQAIEESFKRSWSSIWPSNMASIITAIILYYGTTGMVRGFAVTLAIGIFVSLFTAVTFTRTLMRIWGKNIKRVTL